MNLSLIIADMKDWLMECADALYDADTCDYVSRVVSYATDEVIIGTVADTYDGGVFGFCLATYGRRFVAEAMSILGGRGF